MTALLTKWVSIWLVLLVIGLYRGPSPAQAAVMALVTAVISYLADRGIQFRFQGITRWAIDGGIAAFSIYYSQFLYRGPGISFYTALLAGAVIGAIEIPLHFMLASRFGVRGKGDDRNGVR